MTSVDIDAGLLRDAKKALGVTTTRAAVTLALEESVMRHRQAEALAALASLHLDLDPQKIDYSDDASSQEA